MVENASLVVATFLWEMITESLPPPRNKIKIYIKKKLFLSHNSGFVSCRFESDIWKRVRNVREKAANICILFVLF